MRSCVLSLRLLSSRLSTEVLKRVLFNKAERFDQDIETVRRI